MNLDISNVINISVSAAPTGLGSYSTSNIALFTREAPLASFGTGDFKIYRSPSEVVKDFGSSSTTAKMALTMFSQKPNLLAGGGYLVVIPFTSGEKLDDAIVRTKDAVQYFGILAAEILSSADQLEAAAVVQTLNKILFLPQKAATAADVGGALDLLRSGGFSQSRGLLYVGTGLDLDALVYAAAYAGRGLSVDFTGSLTTATMHLKDLIGVQPDAGMTQTLLEKCKTAGVDVYASVQGVAKVLTSGANGGFFDDVYNQQWLIGSLQIAGFNALARASTKLPQTEQGVGVLKAAYRSICEQAVTNGYSAPGTWNSPDTFGDQGDFFRNIEERGYYIYSQPVAQQLQSEREARRAPLIQIAIKQAGAVHSSNVLVYVNA